MRVDWKEGGEALVEILIIGRKKNLKKLRFSAYSYKFIKLDFLNIFFLFGPTPLAL